MAIYFPEGAIDQPSLIRIGLDTNVTNASSVTFTGIPTHARFVVITFEELSAGGDGGQQRHCLRMGNGSIATSGYYWISTDSGSGNSDTDNDNKFALTNNNHTSTSHSESGVVFLINSNHRWSMMWQGYDRSSNFPWRGFGFWDNSSAIDRVQLFCGSGDNWSGGKVAAFYI